jgi:hypothetical protein
MQRTPFASNLFPNSEPGLGFIPSAPKQSDNVQVVSLNAATGRCSSREVE